MQQGMVTQVAAANTRRVLGLVAPKNSAQEVQNWSEDVDLAFLQATFSRQARAKGREKSLNYRFLALIT